jgi:hypothetical protein
MPLGRDEIRHRWGYHPGTGVTGIMHDRVRTGYIALADFLDDLLPDGDAKDQALKKLQEASMWSNFAVAELSPLVELKPDRPQNFALPDTMVKPVFPKPGPPSQRAKD